MSMYELIAKKRYGGELSRDELATLIGGCVSGEIPDYQISAWLMAVCFNGMTDRETADLTAVMEHSGDTIDLSCFGNLSVDKHSTGGVGDKTTLIVAPIVASLGAKIAKMSGRGLGHTGGTVDKLESIPGYRTTLGIDEFINQVKEHGIAVVGQSANLAPADKKLYALRDVTATVDSIPLITSSIMSKKLASGSKNIVLDVKYGSGAFMKTPQDAEKLAESMVNIGRMCGRNIAAVITNMNRPLGKAMGNSLEVIEAVGALKGQVGGDLRNIYVELAANMVSLVFDREIDTARRDAENAIDSGAAFEKMKEWIAAQGGDIRCIENTELFEKASVCETVTAPTDGYISSIDAEKIGLAGVLLGAGRASKNDSIDFSAGIVSERITGDYVHKGDALYTLFTNNAQVVKSAAERCLEATVISDEKPAPEPLIYKVIK